MKLSKLTESFRTDPDSSYRKKRYVTRVTVINAKRRLNLRLCEHSGSVGIGFRQQEEKYSMGYEPIVYCRWCDEPLDVYQPPEERFCSEECENEWQRGRQSFANIIALADDLLGRT